MQAIKDILWSKIINDSWRIIDDWKILCSNGPRARIWWNIMTPVSVRVRGQLQTPISDKIANEEDKLRLT